MNTHTAQAAYAAVSHLSTADAARALGRQYETVRAYRVAHPDIGQPVNLPVPVSAYTNACPERYRNISHKAECRLRGEKLGTIERPGGLPASSDGTGGKWTLVGAVERRAQIIAALANGPLRNFEIARAIGTSPPNSHSNLERMEADGLIIGMKAGRVVRYALVAA